MRQLHKRTSPTKYLHKEIALIRFNYNLFSHDRQFNCLIYFRSILLFLFL